MAGLDENTNAHNKYDTMESNPEDEADALDLKSRKNNRENYASMPVPKYATHYKMDHNKRGLTLIFNHEHFDGHLSTRSGTNEDAKNLKLTFNWLGFEVHEFKDLNYSEIQKKIEEVASQDFSQHDCIAIVILSHGDQGIIYARDVPYKPEYIWQHFTADKCPTLAGKPKLFFIQACQGDGLDGEINLKVETDGESHNNYKIPVHADFLVSYSTVKGYYSWRNVEQGSWFIQSLCKELRNWGFKYDLLTILTFVAQGVAVDFESYSPFNSVMHKQKQIPCVMSMLTRLLLFKKTSGNRMEY